MLPYVVFIISIRIQSYMQQLLVQPMYALRKLFTSYSTFLMLLRYSITSPRASEAVLSGASWCSWVYLNITAVAMVSTAFSVKLSLARCFPLNCTALVYKYIGMASLRSSNDLAMVAGLNDICKVAPCLTYPVL